VHTGAVGPALQATESSIEDLHSVLIYLATAVGEFRAAAPKLAAALGDYLARILACVTRMEVALDERHVSGFVQYLEELVTLLGDYGEYDASIRALLRTDAA
jgi:hypothetical protein